MVPTSHDTDSQVASNVIPLFPQRARAAVQASRYSSQADDPFATPAAAPPSERWYEDEVALPRAQ